MKKLQFGTLVLTLLSLIGTASCTNDSPEEPFVADNKEITEDSQDGGNEEITEDPAQEEDDMTRVGSVEFLNPDLVDDHYILVNDAGANRVYIMDKEARLLHEWELTNNIGNDVFLLPNSKLLASLESDDPKITYGGQGGRLQFVATDGTVEWDFIYSSEEAETHHDAELLPNGNVIALVWERRTEEQAAEAGFMLDTRVYPEAVIEVNPQTNEIVWEWHAWDHLIQDQDATKDSYGVVSDHPELIDLNYIPKNGGWPQAQGDLMHANAIAYDEVNDVIFISANFYSEVWVIDHSTTREEAAGHSGGTYGKGGDLIYRFGNPEAYENPQGTRLFHNQHFPNPLKGADHGKMFIFSNGNDIGQSTVYKLQLPAAYELTPNADNEPEILWSFKDPELYSPKVSGAIPLPNGNVLITEGTFGFWEVTPDKEVVWRFKAPGFFWRGYPYKPESPEIQAVLGN
ncbi:MAG: aryl-sulfate sulfotransferase [Flavobacteriaceae bacterium]|nr:MAG: aryl-sulfate sulfotransferase [Flavobacteriaceae bacterium]